MKRIPEHIQTYKGCDIMIYEDEVFRNGLMCKEKSFCWGNMCWKDILEAKREIDKCGRPNSDYRR